MEIIGASASSDRGKIIKGTKGTLQRLKRREGFAEKFPYFLATFLPMMI